MEPEKNFPLRVEQVFSAAVQEWRVGESRPPQQCENWQLVYVLGGMIEENADGKKTALRQGQLILHPAGRTVQMRAVGEIPPEVLRLDFWCPAPELLPLGGRLLRADLEEQVYLGRMAALIPEAFLPPEPGALAAAHRPDAAFGTLQELAIRLEMLLIALVRRTGAEHRATARVRRDKAQTALLENTRVWFAQHLTEELSVEQVCRALGCTRAMLQKTFRARTKSGAMEYFAAMKLARARELLAGGASPGEVAGMLGYSSGAYFSRCFKAATGTTPHAYQREAFLKQEKRQQAQEQKRQIEAQKS